jgi:hypothetical protein
LINANPVALELRRLQMLTEIGAENNTTTIVMVPSDFINLAQRFAQPQQNSSTSMNGNTLQPQPFNPEVIVTAKKTEETES